MSTGYVYEQIFTKHTWPNHPENAKRLAQEMLRSPFFAERGLL